MGLVLVFAVIFGGIGYAIGKGKGQAGLGLVLGALLGLIGLIIIAVMKPAPGFDQLQPPQ